MQLGVGRQPEHGGRFVIRTNWNAPNFRLMEVPEAVHADRSAWRTLRRRDHWVACDWAPAPG